MLYYKAVVKTVKQSLYQWSSASGPLVYSLRAQNHDSNLRGYELGSIESDIILPVTALCEFLFCKRCFYLTYKMGLPKPTTKNAIMGGMLHEIHIQLLSKEFKITSKFSFNEELEETAHRYMIEAEKILHQICKDFEEVFEMFGMEFENELSRIHEHLEIVSMKWADWIRKLAITHGVDGVELARICIPYRRFEEYYKAPELALCGKVDLIEHGKPVEVKTGKAPNFGIYPSHALQVIWYALLMEYVEGRDVDYAEVYYAKKFERRRLILTQELREWALAIRDSALELLNKRNLQKICGCYHYI